MNREKLFKVNFIIQAVLTAVSQIINIVQTSKKKKNDSNQESEE